MAEIVRRRSWGGVLPLGRHVSISGSRSIHASSVSIAPSSFQEEQNARHHKQFKLEQALALLLPHPVLRMLFGLFVSMMAASSFGLGPVVPIQAGVSVLLVLTLGPETAGYIRMIDVLIGAAVGAVCGRFLSALKSS